MARFFMAMNGKRINTLDELGDNFNPKQAVLFYRSGRLQKWLEEIDAIELIAALDAIDKNLNDDALILEIMKAVRLAPEQIEKVLQTMNAEKAAKKAAVEAEAEAEKASQTGSTKTTKSTRTRTAKANGKTTAKKIKAAVEADAEKASQTESTETTKSTRKRTVKASSKTTANKTKAKKTATKKRSRKTNPPEEVTMDDILGKIGGIRRGFLSDMAPVGGVGGLLGGLFGSKLGKK